MRKKKPAPKQDDRISKAARAMYDTAIAYNLTYDDWAAVLFRFHHGLTRSLLPEPTTNYILNWKGPSNTKKARKK